MSIPGHHLPAIDQPNTNQLPRCCDFSLVGVSVCECVVRWPCCVRSCQADSHQTPHKNLHPKSKLEPNSTPYTPCLNPRTSSVQATSPCRLTFGSGLATGPETFRQWTLPETLCERTPLLGLYEPPEKPKGTDMKLEGTYFGNPSTYLPTLFLSESGTQHQLISMRSTSRRLELRHPSCSCSDTVGVRCDVAVS